MLGSGVCSLESWLGWTVSPKLGLFRHASEKMPLAPCHPQYKKPVFLFQSAIQELVTSVPFGPQNLSPPSMQLDRHSKSPVSSLLPHPLA